MDSDKTAIVLKSFRSALARVLFEAISRPSITLARDLSAICRYAPGGGKEALRSAFSEQVDRL
jgi:hypothetical protein